MIYNITIEKSNVSAKSKAKPEDTFHVYDNGGMFCSCCSENDTHEYIFEEPEEVVRWFAHRYCKSINESADRVNDIRDGECCFVCRSPKKYSYDNNKEVAKQ